MTSRVVSGAVRLLGGLGLALLACGALAAAPAHAHDVLVDTSPADGATVARPPSAVTLTFDRPALAIGSGVTVTGPTGAVQQGEPELTDNTVRQPIAPAPAGRYTVRWRITSADGHPISGSYTFTAARSSLPPGRQVVKPAASLSASPSTSSSSDGSSSSGRSALLVGAVAGTAAGVLIVLVQRRRRRGQT